MMVLSTVFKKGGGGEILGELWFIPVDRELMVGPPRGAVGDKLRFSLEEKGGRSGAER